jgi:hypothetical protein
MTSTDTSSVRAQSAYPAPMRAVHTANFAGLFRHLSATLLVTTYQAGKLVLIRDDERINHAEALLQEAFVLLGGALLDMPAAPRSPLSAAAHAAQVGPAEGNF